MKDRQMKFSEVENVLNGNVSLLRKNLSPIMVKESIITAYMKSVNSAFSYRIPHRGCLLV